MEKPQELDRLCDENTLVVCDIEGGEYELLDPRQAPGLQKAGILVELHFFDGQQPDTLVRKLAQTHTLDPLLHFDRTTRVCPDLEGLPAEAEPLAVAEFRNGNQQTWAFARSKYAP